MVFVPIATTFSAFAIAVLMLYEIDRSTHQRNVARLASAVDPGSQAAAKVSLTG
jgi:hypothetical protein